MDQLQFVHAIIILPDKRILLRRSHYQSNYTSKWSATIEERIYEKIDPKVLINKIIIDNLNIHISIDCKNPKAVIKRLSDVIIDEHNRIIFPFVVEIKQVMTLKSDVNYLFSAKSFAMLSNDIMANTIYPHNNSDAKHTLNTIYVVREAHLEDVLTYV